MNTNLPIAEFRNQIVEAVNDHDVIVITAETGAGKSTQVPQYLLEAGYTVVATQPRRMAARTVAQRVAEEVDTPLGEIVGFRTAEERYDSPQTKVLFCTDGLQLVRELTGRGSKQQILIIDEVHEWNRNIETLVAWAKYQLSLGRRFKVVLMSATVEAEKLADYFGGAPVISVPGRLFPVEQLKMEGRPSDVAADLARQGRNVLVFVPGKADIAKVIQELEDGDVSSAAEILSLHGELTPQEQNRAFRHYGRPKVVVSTNVAQTSVTIDDIDAVVDSGTEKRVEVRDGVEGLYLGDISQADCKQRMGRAGRTKPGVYVLCSETLIHWRNEFPQPEILRSRLDQLVLRLAEIGLDATELEFFHQPSRVTLAEAKEALKRLGALNDEGKVTDIGRAMSRLPVDVHHARMIVEAERRGVTDEILTIVACLEAGGIRGKGKKDEFGREESPQWRLLTREKDSDLLAELDCYVAASQMSAPEMRNHDIHVKHFYKAKEIRARLARELGVSLHPSTQNDRQEVLKASVAGMVDHLYRHTLGREYVGTEVQAREIDKKSVVERANWITAIPFDLEIEFTTRWGEKVKKMLYLVTSVTKVEPAWLVEVAPQLARSEPQGFQYVAKLGEVVFLTATIFNGQPIEAVPSPAHECPEATLALATALANGEISYPGKFHNDSVKEQVERLYWRHSCEIEQLTTERLINVFVDRLGTVYRVADLSQVNLKLELAEFIPSELLEVAGKLEPETIEVDGVNCQVTYYNPRWSSYVTQATVRVPLDQLSQLAALPALPKADLVERVEVVNGQGEVVASGHSLESLRDRLQRIEKEAREQAERQQFLNEISQLEQQCSELVAEGREVSRLRQIIAEARSKAHSMYGYFRPSSSGEVRQHIRRAEREIERLSGDAATVLLDDLMEGRIQHPDIPLNQEVIKQLDAYAIRSGGFIESLSDEQLRQHYQGKLNGATRVDELWRVDLKLRLEDFAPADILEELELAPDTVELEAKKGTSTYPVSYGYEEIDGERVAVGSITVPIAVCERNCAEVGRKSKFPELPHGARLVITVTDNNQTVARGEDGDWLKGQIKKYRKGKGKKGNRQAEESARRDRLTTLGIRIEGPTAPPPWFRGRAR